MLRVACAIEGARADEPPLRASSLRLYGIDQSRRHRKHTSAAEPHVTEGVRPPYRAQSCSKERFSRLRSQKWHGEIIKKPIAKGPLESLWGRSCTISSETGSLGREILLKKLYLGGVRWIFCCTLFDYYKTKSFFDIIEILGAYSSNNMKLSNREPHQNNKLLYCVNYGLWLYIVYAVLFAYYRFESLFYATQGLARHASCIPTSSVTLHWWACTIWGGAYI